MSTASHRLPSEIGRHPEEDDDWIIVHADAKEDPYVGFYRYPKGEPAARPLDLYLEVDGAALEFIQACLQNRVNLTTDCPRHGRMDVLYELVQSLRDSRTVRLRPCGACSCFVPIQRTGRPAKYCCHACRQAAHRQAKQGVDTGSQLRRSTVGHHLAVPATLPTNWDYIWGALFKQSDKLYPWERFGLLSAHQVLEVPLVWRYAGRIDGCDEWIAFEVVHRSMGRLRIRFNERFHDQDQYLRSLLFGEPKAEVLTLDLAGWPEAWERRSATRLTPSRR